MCKYQVNRVMIISRIIALLVILDCSNFYSYVLTRSATQSKVSIHDPFSIFTLLGAICILYQSHYSLQTALCTLYPNCT
ncbi:hypothetical protein HanRHA438_Chr00c24g0853771 [Helianthus annuus]|nr:hypothetical protein HanRHA438_Chr00c24g0853771 [Helianthus annuus]